MKNYLNQYAQRNTQHTPQSQPILGTNQVKNNAGGFVWEISNWERLKRFLILGSEGGSYYVNQETLTADNAGNVIKCIAEDGIKVVDTVVEVSDSGRAPKNDVAIFVLALCASADDNVVRRYALEKLPHVCRIGTHLFSFVEYINGMRGWGRGLRRGVGEWYTAMDNRRLAYQLVKYRQRNGWTHTDTLRKAHPTPVNTVQDNLFKWVTGHEDVVWKTMPQAPDDEALAFIWAFERVQDATAVATVVNLINQYNLPREAVPTEFLKTPYVWQALLDKMPMTAMIRNLGNMSKYGLLVAGSEAERTVVNRLLDTDRLRKARVHPISLLSAQRVYAGGRALRGGWRGRGGANSDWTPVARVIDALDKAFELAFQNIEPTNKRTMLALDVSGSMGMGFIAGVTGITPREGSAAMAMVTARTERDYSFMAFSNTFMPLNISANMRLDTVIKAVSDLPFAGTDCALPMIYAKDNKLSVDTFVIYTDNETWAGQMHPYEALRDYRQATGIAAKLIVVGMTATQFSIANPNDAGMLDVVGFDSAAPNLMADFARGTL